VTCRSRCRNSYTKLVSSVCKEFPRLFIVIFIVIIDKAELAGDTIPFLTTMRRDWLAGRYISVNWDMQEFLGREDEIVKGDKLKMRMTF